MPRQRCLRPAPRTASSGAVPLSEREDDDLGHSGYVGISGWGWLKHGTPPVNVPQSDWLFVVDPNPYIPTPGSIGLSAIVAAPVVRRVRRRD